MPLRHLLTLGHGIKLGKFIQDHLNVPRAACSNPSFCVTLLHIHMRACMQDVRTLTDVLSNIHVNRVHTVHQALAVLDTLALSMQVFNHYCSGS